MTRRQKLERLIKNGDLLHHISWTDAKVLITELYALWKILAAAKTGNPFEVEQAVSEYLSEEKKWKKWL